MRITNLLDKNAILLNADISDKNTAINTLIEMHDKAGNLSDKEKYKEGIFAREAESTTAVGEGIAIPHAKSSAVLRPGLAAMTVPNGIEYGAPDGKPSNLFFMIAAPEDGDLHLEVLSRLMTLLMDLDLRKKLLSAQTADEFLQMIDEAEEAKFGAESEHDKEKENTAETDRGDERYRIVAVTACPTGIAHTYMAAEALEQKAKELGVSIKVETNGSGGAKNVLTPQEIQEADGVIVAADKNVEMVRFDGKPVIMTNVSKGINEPEVLIQAVIDGKAPQYTYQGGKTTESNVSEETAGRQIYKHLMNGVSYMLPFVIGGMVPPIAIALCATFFKKKWTEAELKSAPVNYIMGLCFITEGAIPYAAADPLRVIPSCIAGSAVAGGLSMAFGCTLRAPHGGIFVFPVVGNVLFYVMALAAGALVGMILLALLKKNIATQEKGGK